MSFDSSNDLSMSVSLQKFRSTNRKTIEVSNKRVSWLKLIDSSKRKNDQINGSGSF